MLNEMSNTTTDPPESPVAPPWLTDMREKAAECHRIMGKDFCSDYHLEPCEIAFMIAANPEKVLWLLNMLEATTAALDEHGYTFHSHANCTVEKAEHLVCRYSQGPDLGHAVAAELATQDA